MDARQSPQPNGQDHRGQDHQRPSRPPLALINPITLAGIAVPPRIWLVTSALHMPRALVAFRAAGFEPCSYPSDFLSGPLRARDVLLRGSAIANSYGPAYVAQPGYVAYPAYAGGPPVGCPGGYWARVPVYDGYGNVIGWRGRPRYFCP